jgi:hypothetical protein
MIIMANKPLMPIMKPLGTPLAGPKETESKIAKIISYGNGWLIVEMTDGTKQKRINGTLAWRNHNPGNLKFGDFAKDNGAIGPGGGGHAVFPDYKTGRLAQKKLLFTNVRGYNTKSIQEAIATYAPSSDKGNKPKQYARYIASQLQVSLNTKLNELSDNKKEKMIDAIQAYEGFKKGTVTSL